MTNDSLQRAIEQLDAVEVAPGKWAFPARTRVRMPENSVTNELWHITDASGIISICVHAKTLSGINAVRMPAWWSPQRQYAWRYHGKGDVHAEASPRFINSTKWVTCDLTTGEEISC